MQIVIDIPNVVWDKAKEYGHLDICGIELSERVINGTPLPKGHGRLIDADAVDTRYSDPEVVETLDDAPTIIEADKED